MWDSKFEAAKQISMTEGASRPDAYSTNFGGSSVSRTSLDASGAQKADAGHSDEFSNILRSSMPECSRKGSIGSRLKKLSSLPSVAQVRKQKGLPDETLQATSRLARPAASSASHIITSSSNESQATKLKTKTLPRSLESASVTSRNDTLDMSASKLPIDIHYDGLRNVSSTILLGRFDGCLTALQASISSLDLHGDSTWYQLWEVSDYRGKCAFRSLRTQFEGRAPKLSH